MLTSKAILTYFVKLDLFSFDFRTMQKSAKTVSVDLICSPVFKQRMCRV